MSNRLGSAFVAHIRHRLGGGSGNAWILVEGVSISLANSIVDSWSEELPPLYVLGPASEGFAGRALGDTPPTQLRNRGDMCLVLCAGQRTPDSQSITGFERIALDELTADRNGIALIASQEPSVLETLDVSTVIKALCDEKLEKPPSAQAVSRYFDAISEGLSATAALNAIGGFRDDPGDPPTRARVVDNLNLATGRNTPERMRPSSLREIRARANNHLADHALVTPDEIVQLLQENDEQLLELITFDEALLIFEEPSPGGLVDDVREELRKARESHPELSEELTQLERSVTGLSEQSTRRAIAELLLEFDDDNQAAIFTPSTRKRLKKLTKDRSISTGCVEEGLVRALAALSSPVSAIELKEPVIAEKSSDAQFRGIISLAAARMRLMPIFAQLDEDGVDIADAITAQSSARVAGAMEALDRPVHATAKPVVLSVKGTDKSDAIEVRWTPSAEDVALLMIGLRFAADAGAVAFTTPATMDAGSFTLNDSVAVDPTAELASLAQSLAKTSKKVLKRGYDPLVLRAWVSDWSKQVRAAESATGLARLARLQEVSQVATIRSSNGDVTLSHLSPLKAEWIAERTEAWLRLVDDATRISRDQAARNNSDSWPAPVTDSARALAKATAGGYPAFIVEHGGEQPMTAVAEGEILAAFGSTQMVGAVATVETRSLETALTKLVDLQPEASSDLRCAAFDDEASDLLVRTVMRLVSASNAVDFRRVEIVCFGGRPKSSTLTELDEFARGENRARVAIKYVADAESWKRKGSDGPDFHIAVIEGISRDPKRLRINMERVAVPAVADEVLFAPKTWVRPGSSHLLLMPPTLSAAGRCWYDIATALDNAGASSEPNALRVPEVRIELNSAKKQLTEMHDLAHWVVTIDRFATRESIRNACGDDIAILHQERRSEGGINHGLVISQKFGGTADRAIERSLKKAGLVEDTSLKTISEGLRKAAAKAYGILALRAATTGSGINELIGHVAGFQRLVSVATPWPLPENSRVLLISLDDYAEWFGPSQRADMLALAISEEEQGVHGANVEVKAVRSAGQTSAAMSKAKEQLKKTLVESRFAAYPDGSLYSRLWLNRIVEAAIGGAREQGIRLTAAELSAIEAFRRGDGTLEWAAVGMVFAPGVEDKVQHVHVPMNGDRVPMALCQVALSSDLLRQSAESDIGDLRTIAEGRTSSSSPSKARRSLTAVQDDVIADVVETPHPTESPESLPIRAEETPATSAGARETPVLGWNVATGDPVLWNVQGIDALSNGHMEVYGTSGAGKTQFLMSLLGQMRSNGTHFGVCDFKNDYAGTFPDDVGAKFFDLWNETLPYNPLAIDDPNRRALLGLFIELRDTVEIAARPYARLGHRQLGKLQEAFELSYENARVEGRIPTLADVHELLDDDLRGVIGDLTSTGLFGAGPPLGSVINDDVIFGLNHIPGTGLTSTLASGFILSSLYLKLLEAPQVANLVSYMVVIDEAHRVANFHSVGNMIRELRSKGLAVVLSTQKPGDLPEEASTNAQTKVFLRLPDAQSAKEAAKALDPTDRDLANSIRSLGDGEAYVSFAGGPATLVRLKQFWRDG